jgi:hypothetical protein
MFFARIAENCKKRGSSLRCLKLEIFEVLSWKIEFIRKYPFLGTVLVRYFYGPVLVSQVPTLFFYYSKLNPTISKLLVSLHRPKPRQKRVISSMIIFVHCFKSCPK